MDADLPDSAQDHHFICSGSLLVYIRWYECLCVCLHIVLNYLGFRGVGGGTGGDESVCPPSHCVQEVEY